MRWTPRGKSRDLEDRRAEGGAGFGGGGFRMGRAAPLGIGGVLILVVLSLVTGQDFTEFLEPGADGPVAPPGATAPSDQPLATTPAEEKLVEFVSFVLDDAQDTWTKLLGPQYQRAKLVTFRDSTESACGLGRAATGPFYCPGDRKIYIDLGFYQELRDRFGAPGEFAQAYVLAHEIGHHVQTLTGIEPKVRRLQEANPERGNELSVRLELQADCYAGVWGHSTNERQLLESGEIDAGLAAAAAIGDDRLQRMGGGRVSPEKFTHGSSGQRVEWFKRGLQSGEPSACETFGR